MTLFFAAKTLATKKSQPVGDNGWNNAKQALQETIYQDTSAD
jgi:hypothetical protein